MQSDKSYRRGLHKIVEDYIPQEILIEKNLNKSWEYGYNSEYDMVVISRSGEIGQILEINELIIALPSAQKNIRNQNLKQREFQKWRRYDVPKELANFDKHYSSESNIDSIIVSVYKKHKKYIDDDYEKILNGDFLYVDGEILYISGGYYFFLQHYVLTDNKYPDFRITQRDYYIWLEACYADNRCYGSNMLKGRRSSFSVTLGCEIIRFSIRKRNGYFPIISKTDRDANKLFTKHIVRPFLKLPKHLQPLRTGEAKPKSKLEFNAPQKKITLNNKITTEDNGLDTIIEPVPTTTDAYDSTEVTISGNDEIGKLKGNLDINESWEQSHKMTHEVGSEIVGKAICGSTANPPKLGGKNYEIFYNDSKLSSRNDTGQTKTGLYSIFIPADFSLRGYFDEFGWVIYDNPDKLKIKNERGTFVDKGAKQFLDAKEAAAYGNLSKYNRQKRNNPRVDTDAFLDEDAASTYDTEGVTSNTNFLKTWQNNPKYKTQVFRFDLSWIDGIQDNDAGVQIKHTDKGRFQCSWLPPLEMRNKIAIRDGKKYPVNSDLGSLGVDPYQSDRAKYGTGSLQGLVGVTQNSDLFLNKKDQNKVFLYYNHRPDTIEEAIDDVIKAMVYLSMPILPETNKDKLVKTLYDRKYRGFVLEDPTKDKKDLSPDGKKYGGIYSIGKTIDYQEESLKSYLYDNLHEEVDEDDLKIPYLKLLEEIQIYGRDNRTKCDSTVALQLATLANTSKRRKKKKVQTEEVTTQDIASLFERN